MYRTPDPVSTPLIPVFFLLPLTFSLCFSGGSQRLIQPCSFSVNSVVVCIEKARARLNVTALILGFQHGDLLKVTSLKYLHGTGPIHHLTIFFHKPESRFRVTPPSAVCSDLFTHAGKGINLRGDGHQRDEKYKTHAAACLMFLTSLVFAKVKADIIQNM